MGTSRRKAGSEEAAAFAARVVLRAAKRLYRAKRRVDFAVTEYVCSGYPKETAVKLGDAREEESYASEALYSATDQLYRMEMAARRRRRRENKKSHMAGGGT